MMFFSKINTNLKKRIKGLYNFYFVSNIIMNPVYNEEIKSYDLNTEKFRYYVLMGNLKSQDVRFSTHYQNT